MNKPEFLKVWKILCKRFGRDFDAGEAGLYHRFLAVFEITPDRLERAVTAIWATREFFPRPVDFLLADRGAAWDQLREALEIHSPVPGGDSGWGKLRVACELVQGAVRDLGGLNVLAREWERAPFRVRDRFFDAYEVRILEEIRSSPELGPGSGVLRLPSPPGE